MDAATLKWNFTHKLFGSRIHYTHCAGGGRRYFRCSLRSVREVIAVRGRIVPNLVRVPYAGNSLANFSSASVKRQSANGSACGHQTSVWPSGKAAQSQIEHSAFAFHRKTFNRIRKFVRVEDIDAILLPRNILVKPPGIAMPNRLLHSVLIPRINVVT